MQECMGICRVEYNYCRLLCETDYCLSICQRQYDGKKMKKFIVNRYFKSVTMRVPVALTVLPDALAVTIQSALSSRLKRLFLNGLIIFKHD